MIPANTSEATPDSTGIEQVRRVLFGAERDALAKLGSQVEELASLSETVDKTEASVESLKPVLEQITAQLEALRAQQTEFGQQILELEALIVRPNGRTVAVSEVLVDAVSSVGENAGVLGDALRPEVEHALHGSAREDSAVLAEALYPVMGPAMRKMIAELFTFGDGAHKSDMFAVSEVLLMERTSGVLLASSRSASLGAESDSDIVSGMLDAIRLFVEQAFDSMTRVG